MHPYYYMTIFPIGDERSFAIFVSVVDSYRSQWFITFKPTPNLDRKHTVFGNLVGGDEVLDALEKLPVKPGTERPAKPIRITDVIMFVNLPQLSSVQSKLKAAFNQLPRSVRGVQATTRETPREESSSRGGSQDRRQGSEEGHG